MRRAGQITAAARALAGKMVRPGVTTLEIDTAVRKFIEGQGAIPSFLHFPGPPGVRDFPGAACISVNDEVIHGIPSNQVLKEGDIVSVDVGAYIGGFHGDCAATFPCGKVSDEAAKLIAVTEQSFWEGMKFARFGYRVSDISHAVQKYVEENGFSVVRDYVGHGVGATCTKLRKFPTMANLATVPGLLPDDPGGGTDGEPRRLAIKVMRDGWTVRTADGSLSAHYENSILITKGEPEILTQVGDLRL